MVSVLQKEASSMRMRFCVLFLLLAVLCPVSYGRTYHRRPAYHAHPYVQRDSRGRIKRSTAAKNAFKREHPCPSNGRSSGSCPGYVIDHVNPLECGGADSPANMQWQTIADSKAKDKTERYCR
jgi:hypothetical protein